MATPLLKRRLNPLLLISTVIALSLLAGVAVVSQDRIEGAINDKQQAQQEVAQVTEQNVELKARIDNTTARIENLQSRILELNQSLEEARNSTTQRSQELREKDERISELESRVEELESREVPSGSSEQLQAMNTSLAIVCSRGTGGDNFDEECREWGHSP